MANAITTLTVTALTTNDDVQYYEDVVDLVEYGLFRSCKGRDGRTIGRCLDTGKIVLDNVPAETGVVFASASYDEKDTVAFIRSYVEIGKGLSTDEAVDRLIEMAEEYRLGKIEKRRQQAEEREARNAAYEVAQAARAAEEARLKAEDPQGYLDLLWSKHDHYYHFSDDYGVQRRGDESMARIKAWAQTHGLRVPTVRAY